VLKRTSQYELTIKSQPPSVSLAARNQHSKMGKKVLQCKKTEQYFRVFSWLVQVGLENPFWQRIELNTNGMLHF
jgi:hypothetical protein